MPAMKSLLAICLVAAVAYAAPKATGNGKKYHFELTKVLAKENVKADVAKNAQPRLEAQIKKAFESHPQLVASLEGAPDHEADHGEPFRRWLTSKGIAGAYRVTVEITDASEELVTMEGKPNTQRLSVHIAIHVLGETIPGRTMGFTGDGQATVKLEIGMKMRDKDRDYAWDGACQTAIDDALKTAFAQLAKGAPKQHN